MKVARRAPALVAVTLLMFPLVLSAQISGGRIGYSAAVPSPYAGPIAPDFDGEIGLFTIPTGDTLPARSFSLGIYGQNIKLVAGQNPAFPVDEKARLYQKSSLNFSLGYGLGTHAEIFASAGEDRWQSRGGWVDGYVNALEFPGHFQQDEARKVRIGVKVALWDLGSRARFALYTALHAPVTNNDTDVNTRRTDWQFGMSGSIGIVTGNADYILSGRRSTEPDLRAPNRIRFAVGTDVPLGPIHWISEIDRNIFDGPDFKEPDYSNFLTGVRVFFGHSGWAVSAALGANVDQLGRNGFSPSPVGGILGLTYSPFPAPPAPPKPLPPAPAKVEETPVEPAPVEPAPPAAVPAPQPRTTTDTIQFDRGGSRLTNIAKAILDGVALRMKNDLNSTAVITGYSDNSGSEDANLRISQQRADAAKAYLVERHAIDAARIRTEAKGSDDAVADNSTDEGRSKNRRAVIVVTIVSGS
jgi:outer membrane protein OmpA-like peptidoglycan-associated protein